MGASSSFLKEQELDEFRKLKPGENGDLDLPVPPEQRGVTDKKGFIIFGILMLILVPFLIYTLVKSDIRRVSYGHDDCGNLCGIKNKRVEGVECSGKDYSNQPYETLEVIGNERSCAEKCPEGYVEDGYVCYGDPWGDVTIESVDLWAYCVKLWWKFVIVSIITTILCILTLVLFRYFPGVLVWGISVLGVLIAIGVSVLFWVLFSQAELDNKQPYLAAALLSTLFSIVVVVVFLLVFKRIQLIILLYQETAKVLFALPLIVLLPILTLMLQLLVLSLMVTTTTYMGTAGELTQIKESKNYLYEQNNIFKFTLVFNIIVTIWALQFFSGCQYMVLSGSVAQWFFKKEQAISPICTSFTNTIRFHLGTIALGSFIITLVAVLKALVKSLISNTKLKCLVNCCCENIEALLKFLSKNAYVETAIYGQSFTRSGKRAVSLLVKNATTVFSLHTVGDFVLAMLQFLLLAISTAIAYGIFMNNTYTWMPTVFSFLINLVIVMVVFGVFQTIVDTLFICYCEDLGLNDGSEVKPYKMTKGFMEFMDKSKESLGEKRN